MSNEAVRLGEVGRGRKPLCITVGAGIDKKLMGRSQGRFNHRYHKIGKT